MSSCEFCHSGRIDEKLDKYLDPIREQKKLWDMKVTVISMEHLEQRQGKLEIRGRNKNIEPIPALLRSVKILRRVLEN